MLGHRTLCQVPPTSSATATVRLQLDSLSPVSEGFVGCNKKTLTVIYINLVSHFASCQSLVCATSPCQLRLWESGFKATVVDTLITDLWIVDLNDSWRLRRRSSNSDACYTLVCLCICAHWQPGWPRGPAAAAKGAMYCTVLAAYCVCCQAAAEAVLDLQERDTNSAEPVPRWSRSRLAASRAVAGKAGWAKARLLGLICLPPLHSTFGSFVQKRSLRH
jgi:hypothetical protein